MFEIGNSLREARLRQKLDFPEVEQAIKIRAKYLRALEDEEFEGLPAQTFVKGFLRAYAEYLGLDGQLYVDEYNSRFVTGDDDYRRAARPRRSSARPRRDRRIETNVLLVALTAIVLVTVFVFAAWKFGGGSDRSPSPAAKPPPAGAPTRARAAPRAARRPAPTRTAVPRPAGATLLVTAGGGNSWLEVRSGSATGRVLYQGTLERGQSQQFVARRLWINVGAPENLRLRLDGRLALLPAGAPRVLVVTPGRIEAAAPGA